MSEQTSIDGAFQRRMRFGPQRFAAFQAVAQKPKNQMSA
jgi:hypothetical protein